MKKIFSILCVCAVAVSATAVPARRDGFVRTAADGTEKTVFLNGDEKFHYLTDAQGNMLDEETLLPVSEEVKAARMAQGTERAKARRAKQETGTERLVCPRGAIILVSYKDQDFQQTNEDMTEWAMGSNYTYNGATGSVHQYFYDQSWGQYDMEIDVYGPVKVSKNGSYYGKDYGGEGNDQHPDELVKEACILAHDSCGADFSKYDANNDGYVDWVVILYAGKGQADGGASNTIWPHQWELSYTGMSFKLDGKTVDHYCCLNEIDGQTNKRAGIGTFCHEFGHVMGLPDLYATEGQPHHTMCEWDIMDYGPYLNGGNTPPSYSAYERWFMGWTTPRVLTDPEDVTLHELNNSKEALLMCDSDAHNLDGVHPEPKTFYLMEARNKEGWDKYLPGEGMLITKIKYNASKWAENKVNNTSSNMGVDLLEAKSNTTSGYNAKGKATDAYPKGATSFTQFADHEITEIARDATDGTITFLYRGGGEPFQGIEDIEDGATAKKVICNGQVLILRNGNTYDLTGKRLD